jgi:L-fuculose-phosphate aldolase
MITTKGVNMMGDPVSEMRVKITEIGRLMFARQLTDASGGNISARVGDYICITPRFAGSRWQWNIRPEQVLIADLQGNLLDGDGQLSRESQVHFRLLSEFPDGGSVIHAHPRNALVFTAARQPIEPVLESSLKFGIIKVAEFAPAHTPDLALHVAAALRGQEAAVQKQAAVVIAPWHGLFALGKDLDAAFDAVERVEVNAFILLNSRNLPAAADMTRARAELIAAVQRFKDAG